MSKIRNKIFIGIFTVLLFLVGNIPNSLANTTSQQQLKVNIELDDSLVEYPIEEIKSMYYALEYINGLYIVYHLIDGEVKEQVITEEEAYYLGFRPDIQEDVEGDKEFELGTLPNGKDIIILEGVDVEDEYRQVITREEQELLQELLEDKGVRNKGVVLGVTKDKITKDIEIRYKEEVKDVEGKKLKEGQEKQEGYKMPVTATNVFNYMLVGVLLIVIGLILYKVKGRKEE